MGPKDEAFLKRLLTTFRIEAEEHVQALSSGLLHLERAQDESEKAPILERIYREAHSLKGGARAVNVRAVETVCQALESVLADLKAARITLEASSFDKLHRTVDTVGRLLSQPDGIEIGPLVQELAEMRKPAPRLAARASADQPAPVKSSDAPASQPEDSPKDAKSKREAVAAPKTLAVVSPAPSEIETPAGDVQPAMDKPAEVETVRIAVAKLDHLLAQSEEIFVTKLASKRLLADLGALAAAFDLWRRKWAYFSGEFRQLLSSRLMVGSTEPSGDVGSSASEIMDFIEWSDGYLKSFDNRIKSLSKSVQGDSRSLNTLVDDLLEGMKKALMMPVSTVLEAFPRLVRDLSRELGKEVDLQIKGGDLEIDRRILDDVKDPLIHLVRNAVDHGIEKPADRARKGKPRRGTVTVAVARTEGNHAEIVVSDDGSGIDVRRVKEAARKRGSAPEHLQDRPSDDDAISIIFKSGVSTSPIVTDISGRGIGLAIVKEKADKIGGRISVDTALDAGTSFRMKLPVSLATYRGILIESAGRAFVVPVPNIERVMRVRRDAVRRLEDSETIEYNGRPLSLVRLSDVLGLARREQKDDDSQLFPVLVLRALGKRIAVSVDAVVAEREVLVKGLGKQLSRVPNLAGVTTRSTGELLPVLNVRDVVRSATKRAFTPMRSARPGTEAPVEKKSVLVAEDSITSRMLIKGILESSGYDVRTAVDGADAWRLLQEHEFNLLVSDVEMPRLSGFELTARVRGDQKLGQLPVVLVTGLGSREDMEHGIDVGANAYIVKSSFDQSNLLEVVERLI